MQTGQTIVNETELCLPVLFPLGERQGNGLFSVTAETKEKSWCLSDGDKYNLGCKKGIGYYDFHMCLQITDDAGTDSWSQVNQCQKGERSPELAHCDPYLWFSNREAKYWSHELKNLLFLACSTVNSWRHFCYHQGELWTKPLKTCSPSSTTFHYNLVSKLVCISSRRQQVVQFLFYWLNNQ